MYRRIGSNDLTILSDRPDASDAQQITRLEHGFIETLGVTAQPGRV